MKKPSSRVKKRKGWLSLNGPFVLLNPVPRKFWALLEIVPCTITYEIPKKRGEPKRV